MGLKHLQVAIWAIGLVSAVGALAQDSDDDGVPDNAPDHCPDTPGVATNYGCPADWEVVIVHGWWEPDDPYDWITDYAICPDGTLQTSYDLCAEYGGWGAFATALYVGGTHTATLEKDDGYESQEEPCQGTACWTPGDWASWYWLHQGTAAEWIVDMTPQCRQLWLHLGGCLDGSVVSSRSRTSFGDVHRRCSWYHNRRCLDLREPPVGGSQRVRSWRECLAPYFSKMIRE